MTRWFFEPLPRRSFEVLVVDPPVHFVTFSEQGQGKSPSAQYRTITDEQIAALKIRELGADDCVVLLWTAGHLLRKSMTWLDAWGFEFKTELCWRKVTAKNKLVRIGCGFLARSGHESILVGTAGRPRRFTFPCSVFDGVAREHSRKPDEFYQLVDQVFPGRTRADIFARERRPGWVCWGDELDKFSAPPPAAGGAP